MSYLFSAHTDTDLHLLYRTWQHAFMLRRLQLGLWIAVFILASFAIYHLMIDSSQSPIKNWWLSVVIQGFFAALALIASYHSFLAKHPHILLLLFSWTIGLVPQFFALFHGYANFDVITWTLLFMGQATLVPLSWRTHLLSQTTILACFSIIFLAGFAQPAGQSMQFNVLTVIYLIWFCVICSLSVLLYERLQWAEFKAQKKLQAEQEKSERLLLNILPHSVADRLKSEEGTLADDFAEVSVLFSDLVGFTELSSRLAPSDLVELLNTIFSTFDRLVEIHHLEKIKTVGDAYMVVAGLPEPHVSNPSLAAAKMAQDMLRAIEAFNQQSPYDAIQIRIGIHTGPVVAGVIGIKKFAYDLWGDTVNIASRMESHGLPGYVQVSETVYQALQEYYRFTARGSIHIKGKGDMPTYLLNEPLS